LIQLTLLRQGQAGREHTASRFPYRIGRAPDADLRIEGEGVWDLHAALQFQPREGFFLEAGPGALVSVNGRRTDRSRLRNGDVIECGSVQMRFWLAPSRQRSLAPREILTWVGLAALVGLQLGLLYHLLG
jgi:hypothetical protein